MTPIRQASAHTWPHKSDNNIQYGERKGKNSNIYVTFFSGMYDILKRDNLE